MTYELTLPVREQNTLKTSKFINFYSSNNGDTRTGDLRHLSGKPSIMVYDLDINIRYWCEEHCPDMSYIFTANPYNLPYLEHLLPFDPLDFDFLILIFANGDDKLLFQLMWCG